MTASRRIRSTQENACKCRFGNGLASNALRFLNPKNKDAGHTFIYNLKTDPTESKDFSGKHPNLVKKAELIMATREDSPYEPWNKPFASITKKY